MSPARTFVLVTLVAIVLATALKAPTFGLTHNEPDEVIYWTLAHSVLERGEYGLQGTKLLAILPAEMYDRPLFHHPPLYVLALVPFAALDAWAGAITVSWFGHALAIAAVGLVAATICRRIGVDGRSPVFWLPLVAIALDPIFLFTSRKLWIDALLGGLTFLAVACALVARSRERERGWLFASGLALGLAGLAKLTAVLALPAIVAAILLPPTAGERAGDDPPTGRPRSTRLVALGCVLVPAGLLIAPWFAVFWAEYGTLLPWWSRPSEGMIARDPLIRAAVSQGPWYYAARLAAVAPLGFLVAGLALGRRLCGRPTVRVALILAVVYVVGLTLIAQAGGSPHFLRYLIPMSPFAAVLLAASLAFLPERRGPVLFAATLAIAYAAAGAVPYLFTSQGNALFSLLEDAAGWYR